MTSLTATHDFVPDIALLPCPCTRAQPRERRDAVAATTIDEAVRRAHALRAKAMRAFAQAAARPILTLFGGIAAGLRCRRRGRLAARQLARIDNAVLADIGIGRGEIHETVATLLQLGDCGRKPPRVTGTERQAA